MTGRELAKEFEKKEDERRENPGTDFFRSYYGGYGLQEMKGEDGIVRNEYIYSGILYSFQGVHAKRTALKVMHIFLSLLAAGCLVFTGMQKCAVNSSRIFAAPFFVCIVLTVLWIFTSFLYAISPDLMQEWDFKKAVKRLRLFSILSAFAGAAGIIVSAALTVSYSVSFALAAGDLAGFAGFLACAAIAFAVESRQIYAQVLANDVNEKFTVFG